MIVLASILAFFSPHGGCTDAIIKQIDAAKVSVYVQAYSFTSEPIAQALERAKVRNVDVRVLLDKSWRNESPKVEPELVAAGIPVLIDGKHAIAHNKLCIIDNAIVTTGSFNLTNQAERMNAENLLVIHDAGIAAKYTANWQAHAAHSVTP